MKKLGIGLLAGGIILVVVGLNESKTLNSEVSRVFTGSPTKRTTYFLMGGGFCCVLGAGLLFGKGR